MPVTESKRRANDKYNASCDYISIRPKRDVGNLIRAAAKNAGQSVQGYILQAIMERIEKDGFSLEQ